MSIPKALSRPCRTLLALAAALVPAGAAVNVKINFQPNESQVPPGFVKDIGLPFDAARGYGWITEASVGAGAGVGLDLRPNTRDRNVTGIARELKTLIQFQDPIAQAPRVNTRGAWEYALPPGTYKVVASMGDPSNFDSRHYLNVEGASLIHDFIGTAARPFRKDSVFVTVEDGRLTVDGIGGSNSKLQYLNIEDAGGPGGEPGDIRLQNLDGVPYDDRLVFSRINGGTSTHRFHDVAVLRVHNEGPGTLTLTSLQFTVAGKWTLPNNDQAALPIALAPGSFRDIPVKFVETSGSKGIREGELIIGSDDPDEAQARVQLAGAFMTYPEGNNEVRNPDILKAYGYQVRMLGAGQSLATPYLATGEEVISANWRKARPALPVTVRQLAAFHGCCTDPVLFEMVGTGGGSFRHAPAYGQSFLPLKQNSPDPAGGVFNPTGLFQFRIAGYTVAPNSLGHRGVRMWPVRDPSGALVPDAYFLIQDYVNGGAASNQDFNDNLYLVTNIQPELHALNPSIPGLFPGVPSLALDFSQGRPGTLLDKDGLATGFVKAQANKNDRTNVNSSYLAAALDMDVSAGTLTVSTSAGGNAGSGNSLVNGLVVPFDGRHTRFSVRAVLKGPLGNLNAAGRQAGVMLGADQDHFVKLSAGVFSSGGAFSLQFQREIAGVATTISTLAVPNPASLVSLELVLRGNPATGTVTAAYNAVYSGSQAGGALSGSAAFTGTAYPRIFDRKSYGGILAVHGASTATSVVFDRFAVQSEASAGSGTLRLLNVAGPAYTAADGRTWGTDAGLFAPATAPAENGGTPPPAIAHTADDALYQTYRGKVGASTPQAQRILAYQIPVGSPRTVQVRLHFAELYHGAPGRGPAGPGKRVFDVSAEGRTVLEDFDLTAATGAAVSAVVVPIEGVQVNDGSLTLVFRAEVDFAAINAIEVLQH